MTKTSVIATTLAVTLGFAVTATNAQPGPASSGSKELTGNPNDGKELSIKYTCYGCHGFSTPSGPSRKPVADPQLTDIWSYVKTLPGK